MPTVIALIIKLMPTLITIAEWLFKKPQSGAEKKSWVMGIVDSLMKGASIALTGGAAETWVEVKPEIDKIVDGTVSILFPKADVNDPKYSTGA